MLLGFPRRRKMVLIFGGFVSVFRCVVAVIRLRVSLLVRLPGGEGRARKNRQEQKRSEKPLHRTNRTIDPITANGTEVTLVPRQQTQKYIFPYGPSAKGSFDWL